MNTTATIKTSTSVTAVLQGDSPIFGGALSFNSGNIATESIFESQVISKRILYSDLAVDGTNREYNIIYTNNTLDVPTNTNIAGALVDIQNSIKIIYARSNAEIAVTGGTPLPSLIPANAEVLLRGNFTLDPPVADYGDLVINLSWTQAALNAIGASNFYCDLIIG